MVLYNRHIEDQAAQQVTAFAMQPGDLSLIVGTHVYKDRKRAESTSVVLSPPHTHKSFNILNSKTKNEICTVKKLHSSYTHEKHLDLGKPCLARTSLFYRKFFFSFCPNEILFLFYVYEFLYHMHA